MRPNVNKILSTFCLEFQNATLSVFNRWGNVVYTTTQTTYNQQLVILKWNGTYKNQAMPTGTYFYIVESTNFNNQPKNYKSFVQLVR
jgi:gliding motility-associated-like protein